MDAVVDVLIVGAGMAGLSCARALGPRGVSVRVLDRSPWVGGRCASKAAASDGLPLDFGPVFVHGDDPEFLGWLDSLGDRLVPGWPRAVEGRGTPCLPQAFDPLQRRFGVPSGLRFLAEDLARGTEVCAGVTVSRLVWEQEAVRAETDEGQVFRGRNLVLALALEQSRALLSTLSPGPGAAVATPVEALLGQFSSLPCLTVLASYGPGTPVPAWDVWYPENSASVLLVSNEGSKRGLAPDQGALLTVQARPGWSRARLGGDRDLWHRELLDEAAALLGPWAARPASSVAHRWKYGRLSPSDHLVRPLVLERPGSSASLGLIGDLFDPDGGLQGAWRSGRQWAQRQFGA